MFSNKNVKLSKVETELIERLREDYANAYNKRGKNPTDFYANIQCLREITPIVNRLLSLQLVHGKIQETELNKMHHSHFLFRKWHEKKLAKEINILGLIQNIFFTPSVKKEISQSFKDDTRINYLSYHENQKLIGPDAGITGTYTIRFVDSSELTFHDLKPETLQNIREQFNAKMQELDQPVRRNTM